MSERGYGALQTGVAFAEANDALHGALKTKAGANVAECAYVEWEGGPEGLGVMVSEGQIGRIEVKSPAIPTDAGARVGDTEAAVMQMYAGRVAVTPHKYTDGHYLTVRSANASDTLHFIIFETEQDKVMRYRAGILPAVGFVEGCS